MPNSEPSFTNRRRPPLVEAVWVSRSTITFDLEDGRSITAPLSFYPSLLACEEELRNQYEIHGASVYWSSLRLKLSSTDLLTGRRKN